MFVALITLEYALLVSQRAYGHFLKLTDAILLEYHDKSSPFNSTHYVVLYPQNGDPIVTIDSVTSLQPMYICMKCPDVTLGCIQSHLYHFVTARCYASAVLAMALCHSVRPSVCPSQVGILLKRLNVRSRKQHHTIAKGL